MRDRLIEEMQGLEQEFQRLQTRAPVVRDRIVFLKGAIAYADELARQAAAPGTGSGTLEWIEGWRRAWSQIVYSKEFKRALRARKGS